MGAETAVKGPQRGPAFPFLDLGAQYAPIREEILAAMTRVMDSHHYILGPEVAAFEKEAGAYIGAKHAIGCASGSDALLLALMALGVGAGDEVIVPPFTFVATAGAVARLGARPIFVDIDPLTFNIAAGKIERAITDRTKAIIPVHLFGLSADMDEINRVARRRGIAVIEDAAQAIGAKFQGRIVGTLGDMCCFSFFPSKNLGGAGDGGLITTNDDGLAEKLKVLRVHGSRKKYEYEVVGVNSRLDSLQAAILRVKLKYLDHWAEGRRANAEQYRRLFAAAHIGGVRLPSEPSDCYHVYNQFTLRAEKRDALCAHLQEEGIPTVIYYPSPLHVQPAFAGYGYKRGDFPETEAACREVVSLPIYPEMTPTQRAAVVNAVAAFEFRA
jgi:dTDP-4-amino-4,6-dideoxygalactose transaminase